MSLVNTSHTITLVCYASFHLFHFRASHYWAANILLFYQSFMYYSYCAYNITFQGNRSIFVLLWNSHTAAVWNKRKKREECSLYTAAELYCSTIWCKESIQPNACHSHSSRNMCFGNGKLRHNGKFITCQAQNVKYHSYINRFIHLMHFSMDFPRFAFRWN